MLTACLAIIATASSLPQSPQTIRWPTPEQRRISEAYHRTRLQITEPPFGLEKVKKLIKTLDLGGPYKKWELTDHEFNSLSVSERFTYTLIYPEEYGQNCGSVIPAQVGEEHLILAKLPENYTGFGDFASLSERQRDFLKRHRSAAIKLARQTIAARHQIGMNLKRLAVELNAYELFPELITQFNVNQADNDVLTVLAEVMHNLRYKPMGRSQIGHSLYGPSGSYRESIRSTPYNRSEILGYAENFYRSKTDGPPS